MAKKKKLKKKSNNKTASSLQLVIRVEVKHARPSTSSKHFQFPGERPPVSKQLWFDSNWLQSLSDRLICKYMLSNFWRQADCQ